MKNILKKNLKRKIIAKSCSSLLEENQFQNISISKLAQTAGIGKGTIYEYFKNKEELFTFYDFPADHWLHIRSTNAIESTFATIRLRTAKTRGMGNAKTAMAMVFKLMLEAEKKYAKLKGYRYIPLVMEGQVFKDGILEEKVA